MNNGRVTVHIYSRHNTSCGLWKGSDEARTKGWTYDSARNGCGCPKLLAYRVNHKTVRKMAEAGGDHSGAQVEARKLELSLLASAAGEIVPESLNGGPKLLEFARDKYLDYIRSNGRTEKHIGKVDLAVNRFLEFCHRKGLVTLHDLSTEHFVQYRTRLMAPKPTGQGLKQETARKRLDLVIGLFTYAVEMNWLQRNPGKVRTVKIEAEDSNDPKALSEAQFSQLLAAVDRVNGQTSDEQRRKLRAILLLMRWTGLGNRDALFIERNRFEQNGRSEAWKLFLRRAKTGKPVHCILRNEIVQQIMAGANPKGRYLFLSDVPAMEKGKDNAVQALGDLADKLDRVAGLKDEDGQPWHFTLYQLRHTFVAFCLNKGLPTEDIAQLLGNTPAIVQRHYSGWIADRQERLNERMYAALGL